MYNQMSRMSRERLSKRIFVYYLSNKTTGAWSAGRKGVCKKSESPVKKLKNATYLRGC